MSGEDSNHMQTIPVEADKFSSSNQQFGLQSVSLFTQENPQNNHTLPFSKDMLKLEADLIWQNLCIEGGNIARNQSTGTTNSVVAIEVGAFNSKQCYFAASQGMQVHCLEPSRNNYRRTLKGLRDRLDTWEIIKNEEDGWNNVTENVERISMYNMAAGNVSGVMVPFIGNGKTGDHIGNRDPWKTEYQNKVENKKRYTVPMIKLDDLINNKIRPTLVGLKKNSLSMADIKQVFVMKVDTQGFEPSVFSGLMESIEKKKIQFILFEYWPKGMDLLSNSEEKCDKPVGILKQLVAANYKLYVLRVNSHPFQNGRLRMNWDNNPKKKWFNGRPLDSFESHCLWYYEYEKLFPDANYTLGFWTDILAISSDAKISEPVTDLGRILTL